MRLFPLHFPRITGKKATFGDSGWRGIGGSEIACEGIEVRARLRRQGQPSVQAKGGGDKFTTSAHRRPECTKIAQNRLSLATFHRKTSITHGICAAGISFAYSNRRENRRSLAIFDRREIAHLGALQKILRSFKER